METDKMNTIKLKYCGNNAVILHCDTYSGIVKPGQIVSFEDKIFKRELLNNPNWIKINKEGIKK